jgi:hypothetical protein
MNKDLQCKICSKSVQQYSIKIVYLIILKTLMIYRKSATGIKYMFYFFYNSSLHHLSLSKICLRYASFQCPLFLSNFNQNWNVITYFSKLPNIKFNEKLFASSQAVTCCDSVKCVKSNTLRGLTDVS